MKVNKLEGIRNFKNFLFLTHKYLRLPNPTKFQYQLCDDLTSGDDRLLIEAFRLASKSHIASIWCLWLLYWDNELKILIVSATNKRAANFVRFSKSTIALCPFMAHMRASKEQRDEATSFDVEGCLPSHTPSLCAKSILSQITGDRAHVIICDDVESSVNSLNNEGRTKLLELSTEVENIIHENGTILWLGTPQTASSIYNSLPDKGYLLKKYPWFKKDGSRNEVERFSDDNIAKRRKSMGESKFQLHWMLNTDLADQDKFPLKLADLLVDSTFTRTKVKEEYKRSETPHTIQIPEAKGKDRVYTCGSYGYTVPMTRVVLALDPSGGGDEFAWTVAGTRNGYVFALANGAWDTGLNRNVVRDIQALIKKFAVNQIVLETNYGGDTLIQLLKPNVAVPIIPIKNTKIKEHRIIGTLEPLLNQRKLVVTDTFLQDTKMIGQFCNITYDKGSLKEDDRIDSLEMAVSALNENLNINLQAIKNAEHEHRLQKELDSMSGGSGNRNWING